MRLKLSQRFNLYVGGILLLGILVHIYHDIKSDHKVFESIGISEAERLSDAIFDQLYASMKLGGGRAENKAVIERFKRIKGIKEIRIVHGKALDAQFGIEEDEVPLDEYDRKALEGSPEGVFEKTNGSAFARFVKPVVIAAECRKCHSAQAGVVAGAISVKVSFDKYDELMAAHARDLLLWGLMTVLLLSLAVFLTVRKRLLGPVDRLKEGASAIAAGNLEHRVGLKTEDEFEELGRAFDDMAESLREASKSLNELGDRHSKLVSMAPDAILLVDLQTRRFADANPAAEVLTGYSRDELIEKSSESLFPPEKAHDYGEVFRRWVHDGKGYLHDAVIVKKDGFTVPVEIASSVFNLHGKRYMQEIWRDLTERKGFEDTIRRHVEELEKTVRERTAKLNNSLGELEEAYRKLKSSEKTLIESAKLISLGEMGAGIAHELNSPLAGILSITEVLLKRIPPEDRNHFLLEKVKDATVRSKYIILDMMAYARPSKEGFAPIFLNEAIRATLTIFISEINTHSIEVVESLDPELPKVHANRGQIMEVVLNIIKNARDAIGGNGRIYISTRALRQNGMDYAMAEIRDTGPGIPDDVLDKIFDPFFTTKEKGGGMNIGLGLSICQSIIKEHGGRIEAENSPEGGATFRFYIPFAAGEGKNPENPLKPEKS